MGKVIRKLEVIEMEKNGTEVSEVKETAKVKTKWSLKKKLLLAGAAVLGLGIGAWALVRKQKELLECEEEVEEVNDDEEVIDEVEETEEIPEEVVEPAQDSGV